ncbi:MAG: hypothetical protein HRU19_11585 [Pseudobacteriovorax sp.]|nr:hypothetical protein [Pseudobacteriovorax sp.]
MKPSQLVYELPRGQELDKFEVIDRLTTGEWTEVCIDNLPCVLLAYQTEGLISEGFPIRMHAIYQSMDSVPNFEISETLAVSVGRLRLVSPTAYQEIKQYANVVQTVQTTSIEATTYYKDQFESAQTSRDLAIVGCMFGSAGCAINLASGLPTAGASWVGLSLTCGGTAAVCSSIAIY